LAWPASIVWVGFAAATMGRAAREAAVVCLADELVEEFRLNTDSKAWQSSSLVMTPSELVSILVKVSIEALCTLCKPAS